MVNSCFVSLGAAIMKKIQVVTFGTKPDLTPTGIANLLGLKKEDIYLVQASGDSIVIKAKPNVLTGAHLAKISTTFSKVLLESKEEESE